MFGQSFRGFVVASVLCAASVFGGAAQAAPVVTAEFDGGTLNSAAAAGQSTQTGQSFLATVSGTIDTLTLNFPGNATNTADLTVTLFDGVPGDTVLGTKDFAVAGIAGGDHDLDLASLGISVVAGQTYSFALSSPGASTVLAYLFRGQSPGGYADGERFVSSNGGSTFATNGADLRFVVTVNADAVLPAPATGLVLVVSLAAMARLRRRI
jgi:phage tail sheath gpL-like